MGLLKLKVKTLKVVKLLRKICKVFHFINSAKEIFNYSENFQLVVLFQRKEGHVEIIQLNGSLIWTMVDVLDFGMVGVMVMEIVIEQKKSVIKSV